MFIKLILSMVIDKDYAQMVELVDTQDLKSCDLKSRAGSIPALSTIKTVSNESANNTNAKVAQLVEHDLAKVGVASSNLVFRSKSLLQRRLYILKKHFLMDMEKCSDGGTGRHAGLKIL
jgi:hypothetical protein